MLSLSFAFCISSPKDLEELCLHWGSLSKAIGKEPPLNRLSSLSGLNVNYVITSVACAWHPSVPFPGTKLLWAQAKWINRVAFERLCPPASTGFGNVTSSGLRRTSWLSATCPGGST